MAEESLLPSLFMVKAYILHNQKKKISHQSFLQHDCCRPTQWCMARYSGTHPEYFWKHTYWQYHFLHRIPATKTKLKGQYQKTYKVCVESGRNKTGKGAKKLMTVYCWKCEVKLCLEECFENYHSEINYWGVFISNFVQVIKRWLGL